MSGPLFISSGDLIADRRYDFARAYAPDGDLAAAADLYAQAVELVPGFASAWFALGEAREALGDREGAGTAFARAPSRSPSASRASPSANQADANPGASSVACK